MSASGSGSSSTPENAVADQSSASPCIDEAGPPNPTTAAGNDRPPAAEKTISCVSCRGRKLKCDRVKPKCGTCTRLRHNNCEYPERRRNTGARRRNMRDLEARLAQVETKLVSESAKSTNISDQTQWVQGAQAEWDILPVDITADYGSEAFMDEAFPMGDNFGTTMPSADLWPQAVPTTGVGVGVGLQEGLPPAEMIDDLHQIYFDKLHSATPMIHKQRYFANLKGPEHARPPLCLQYAIWAAAASISEKYSQCEALLYERARKYMDADEMKDYGDDFVTVQSAQTCGLIATYEARKAFFTRAWMTIGRMVRLVQMLGLQRLDCAVEPLRQVMPPPKDWIELEERRRTFWVAFHGDRWSSSGTGWAMIIQEKDITTHLPSSDEAFDSGIMEPGITLKEALTPSGVSKISIFGGNLLSACLFGHNFAHIHQSGPEDKPEDTANGEFWITHRAMDNVLSNTFLFLPSHLRLPWGARDIRIVFLHMNLHTAAICLHQTAIVTAERNHLDPSFIQQYRSRCFISAEEILNIMKLVSHVEPSNMNPWTGFCLYAAATVFIQNEREEDKSPSNLSNLEFLLAAMKAIGKRHTITTYFANQVEIDIEESGILIPRSEQDEPKSALLSERGIAPKTIYNLCSYIQARHRADPTLRGPLLAGILSRSDQNYSPHDSPLSAPLSNMNSTPSSKNIDPPADNSNTSLSFFYKHPEHERMMMMRGAKLDASIPTPGYTRAGEVEDFVMFPYDANNPAG